MRKTYYLYEREITGEKKLYTSKEKALIQAIRDYAMGVKEEIQHGSGVYKEDTIPSSVIFDICDLFEWGSTFEGEDLMYVVEVPVVEEENN